MKLAKIILPLLDNAGRDLFEVHRQLQFELVKRWGGYTSYEGLGGWKDIPGKLYSERVAIYDIAMPLADVVALRELAHSIGARAHQQSVMFVTPNGDVDFVKIKYGETLDEPRASGL